MRPTMEPGHSYRPRVSRETQRLLLTALLALATLWVLARLSEPNRPVAPNPIPPLFRALERVPSFDDLAFELSRLQSRLDASLLIVSTSPGTGGSDEVEEHPLRVALRLGGDVAIASLPPRVESGTLIDSRIRVRDPVSGLSVLQVPSQPPGSLPLFWAYRPNQPQFFMATSLSSRAPSLRPVFIGSLEPISHPAWDGPVWAVPPEAALTDGSFLFTSEGELVGLGVAERGEAFIVPADVLVMRANQLVAQPSREPGVLGFTVQPLDAPLRAALGVSAGLVVSWVAPDGPAANALAPADVVEAVDAVPLTTIPQWQVWTARLEAGTRVQLDVVRRGQREVVTLTAAAPEPPSEGPRPLGLVMRNRPGRGSEITSVEGGSAADLSGLRTGDVITLAGSAPAPTPAQVTRAFSTSSADSYVLLGVARADEHRVMAIRR